MTIINRLYRINKPLNRYGILLRHFVNVGDKVDITYSKDAKPILIKEDKEYPDWIFTLTDKLPTRAELIKKMDEEGVDELTKYENRRLRRLLTVKEIKDFNQTTLPDED
eukprot:gene19969-25938_t